MPAEVRASLPPTVQAYLAFFEGQMSLLNHQLADLQGHAHQNSGNYTRPPLSDSPGARPHLQRKPTGRKRCGQQGNSGHTRILLDAEQITARIKHRVVQCPACTLPLDATLPVEGEPIGVQVWEIPPITAEVTEHQGYRVRCRQQKRHLLTYLADAVVAYRAGHFAPSLLANS